MASNIGVTWETVCDGKTRQGANLEHNLKELIKSGYVVDIQSPDGINTFNDAEDFEAWFHDLANGEVKHLHAPHSSLRPEAI